MEHFSSDYSLSYSCYFKDCQYFLIVLVPDFLVMLVFAPEFLMTFEDCLYCSVVVVPDFLMTFKNWLFFLVILGPDTLITFKDWLFSPVILVPDFLMTFIASRIVHLIVLVPNGLLGLSVLFCSLTSWPLKIVLSVSSWTRAHQTTTHWHSSCGTWRQKFSLLSVSTTSLLSSTRFLPSMYIVGINLVLADGND